MPLISFSSTGNEFHCVMVLAIDFRLVNTMFDSHLCRYLSTGNGLCDVMVIATDVMLVDKVFDSYLCR